MIPILYTKNESVFSHNGIGVLKDTVSAIVTEERNGSYELSLQYPITGQWYENIAEGCIIKAKANETSTPQLFRIYKSSKPLKGVVTYSAEHISYDLNGIPTLGLSIKSATPQMALTRTFENAGLPCPFTAVSDISTFNSTEILTPCSVRAILGGQKGSILDVWGGEYEFDNFTVRLHEHRGTNSGVLIEYGKNLNDLNQEANIAECYTHLMPYAKYTREGEGEDAESQEVYVFLTEKTIALPAAENIGHSKAYIIDFTDRFAEGEAITEEALRQKATAYASSAQLGAPKISITVSFVQLWQTEEYKNIAPLERVKLCDTVTVRFPKLGVDATAKVVKTVYDSLKEKYNSVELGDAKSNLADTINGQQAAIEELKSSIQQGESKAAEALKKAILNATNLITGHSGGYVVLNPAEKPQEILILDAPTIEEAVKVWRWNSGGLGYSSTGYNGTFALAMTMDGAIVADFITAGTFNGALLKADSVEAAAISARYKQEVADQIGTVEKTVTQAFKVADEQLLSTISVKLNDYATTKEMTSAITQKADEIALTVAVAETNANKYTDEQRKEITSEITALSNKISLVVTSSNGSNVIDSASIIAAINGDTSSVSISASKVNLTAYAKSSQVYDIAETAAMDAIETGISLTATNGTTSSTIAVKYNGVTVDSAVVKFTGVVTFSDLSTEGETTIHGGNIMTDTLTADAIGANNGTYITFNHPIALNSNNPFITGIEWLSFGEYGYISKGDLTSGTPLEIYSYKATRFTGAHPVYYSGGRSYPLLSTYNIDDYIDTTAVFG